MDRKDKLNLFREMVLEDTEISEAKQLASLEDSLKKIFKDHKHEKSNKNRIIIETEIADVRKERNKQHAQFQLQMQHDLHKKQEKLKREIFDQVEKRLEDFMQTDDYMNLLERQINQALSIANGEQIIIYVDPADESKVQTLEQMTGHEITVSDRPFIGGIRGVIQSRNILIDYSMLKRLEAEKENFSFDFAEEEDGI